MALDKAARQGFADSAFEESEEDGAAVVEEFYPQEGDIWVDGTAGGSAAGVENGASAARPGLAHKLSLRAAQMNGSSHVVAAATGI